MKELKDVLGKKDRKPDADEKEAKLSALKDMRSHFRKMMGDDLHGKMTKATVVAPDKDALKEGLEKAAEVVEETPELDMEGEESESAEESTEASKDSEIEDLKRQIEELKSLIKK